MIPKKIHYCWFGSGEKSDLNKKCMETWHKYLGDFEWKEWNEHNSPMDLRYLQEAFENNLWSRISNYIRLHALYKEGGIYLDLDIELLKPLDDLLENECFVGFQMEKKSKD